MACSDGDIAATQTPKPITVLADELNLLPAEVEPYGKYKAKIALSTLDRLQDVPNGRYICVAG